MAPQPRSPPHRLLSATHRHEAPVVAQADMGWARGLEPPTLGTTTRCSIQLSYAHHTETEAPRTATFRRLWSVSRLSVSLCAPPYGLAGEDAMWLIPRRDKARRGTQLRASVNCYRPAAKHYGHAMRPRQGHSRNAPAYLQQYSKKPVRSRSVLSRSYSSG